MTRGRFISFEGGEGGGKSTQVRRLTEALGNKGVPCLATREPGGSPGAESIRELLVQGEIGRWDPMTETLLHFAARCDHVARIIEPALDEGTWVVCDRYTDSTIAYQGYGQGVDISIIEDLHCKAVGGLWPDATVVLDVPVSRGLGRTAGREDGRHRYEEMGIDFHERSRQGFLEIAKRNGERCVVVDATGSPDSVHDAVMAFVTRRFGV